MNAEIISIGNEVVDGSVLNTNATWLAERLSELGLSVKWHTAVPDEETLMLHAFATAAGRARWVLVTGGLGPTVDDFTMEVAAKFFGQALISDPLASKKLKQRFERMGRELTPNQEKQTRFPKGAAVLLNENGTAPGAYYEHHGVGFAFFPGVSDEMHVMFEKNFLPILQKHLGKTPRRHLRVLRCYGMAEGQMDQALQDALQGRMNLFGAQLGFRVRFPTIDIRLSVMDSDASAAQKILDQAADVVREKLGRCVFGEGEDQLEEMVGKLLREKNQTVATAESCTGGLLAAWITDVPGASDYFLEGVVTYSNAAKVRLLGVKEATLKTHGAVSAATALEMARGVREKAGSDFGVAVTGIAGPSGGTPEKPVGTVHIAVVHPGGEWEHAYCFNFGRKRFKQVAAATALDRLRRLLLDQ
jgi:nicotinamide-nucleotide amidase